jgi:hypothetical protein
MASEPFYCETLKDLKILYKPEGEWKKYNDERSFFYKKLLKRNYTEAAPILGNFWRNQLGFIVKEYAKFEELKSGNLEVMDPFLLSIGRNYCIWRDLFHLPVERLHIATTVGNTWGCRIEGELITPKATRFHTAACQISNLAQKIKNPVIAEIGGGYGGMVPYLFTELPSVKYLNFDLPEMLVIDAFHVLNSLPKKRIFLYGEAPLSESTFSDYDVLLLPNYVINDLPAKSVDIFYNSFSLSEMPIAVIDNYLEQIARLTRFYFLHNNMDRKGVINRGFERTPSSEFPMTLHGFQLLSCHYDLFHSHYGDYKEYLYAVSNSE